MRKASLPPWPSDWQEDFQRAVSSGQLQTAKAAIFSRLKAKADHPPSILERIALNDAIHLLECSAVSTRFHPMRKAIRASQ